MNPPQKTKQIATNRYAHHEYEVIETYEAGIVLSGKEIKAIRAGIVSIKGSYARIMGQNKQELFWINGTIGQDDPNRSRKLLIHKSELNSLTGKTVQKGLTLIPLSLYLKRGRAKLSIGLARGKNIYDKRQTLKKRDIDRELRRSAKV